MQQTLKLDRVAAEIERFEEGEEWGTSQAQTLQCHDLARREPQVY
jgi:hypothetical protein